jgi:glycosyltransferase involved in cell wall biosynthesis
MASSESEGATGTVFVVGAYIPNGGTYIAYRLARMLHLDFGWPVVAVGDEQSPNSIQHYDVEFPSISLLEMKGRIRKHDILIANPSFSHHMFGLGLPGRKLMYIQGLNTYSLLDCFFDHYVCVSHFVADFVKRLYGIDAPVIPAFIQTERLPRSAPWAQRPAGSVVIHAKDNFVILERIRAMLATRAPEIKLLKTLESGPHQDFLAQIGSCRYLLAVSPAEGFGLVPLEAMAMGTTVVAFDGFGGREYMRSGVNCLATTYPDIDGLVDHLIAAVRNPVLAEQLASAGRETAQHFNYAQFQNAWHTQLKRFLGSR